MSTIDPSSFSHLSGLDSVRNVERLPGAATPAIGDAEKKESSFGDLLKEMLATTNHLQVEADHQSRALLAGENRNVHETMIALEKAGISFRLLNQIRNRAVEAYREILRMQM